jgi:hypothetical protein
MGNKADTNWEQFWSREPEIILFELEYVMIISAIDYALSWYGQILDFMRAIINLKLLIWLEGLHEVMSLPS